MNFTQCDNKPGIVECFALVKTCDKKSAKNGTEYLDLVLADKDSEIVAKLWDFKEGTQLLPVPNTIIKVRGTLQQYNGTDQLIIQRLRAVNEFDRINAADFVKSSDIDGETMFGIIISIADSFKDEELKAVVKGLYNEHKAELLDFPAAERLHHAMRGGLLYHTLSIVRVAQGVCDVYPSIDSDLLLAGAMLHDIAKRREYTVNAAGLVNGRSLEGELLGHLVLGAQEVGVKCDELGVNPVTKTLLEHMLISHHGKPEFGAAERPAFIEAEILSQLDLLDAVMYEMAEAVGGVKPGEFTPKLWMLDNRKLFNHGRIPVEPTAKLADEE